MKSDKRNTLAVILFLIYMLLLSGIIIFKLPFYSEKSDGLRVINLIPFYGSFDENGNILFREILYNILLFVPLGIFICMFREKWTLRKKIIPIIILTIVYEVIQFIFAMGRSDITDVIDNTLGGLIGIGTYALLYRIFRNRTASIVSILALTLGICVVLRFSYLFYLSFFVMGRPNR